MAWNCPPTWPRRPPRIEAGRLMSSDPRPRAAMLLEVAAAFAALGDRDRALEARAVAALAQEMAGDRDAAGDGIAAAVRPRPKPRSPRASSPPATI